MFPQIEVRFDEDGMWNVIMKGSFLKETDGKCRIRRGDGRHWLITVALTKAAWEYYHDK